MGSNKLHQKCVLRLRHPEGDYYATEPEAAHDLMRIEPDIRHIWEPACGEGHLAKEFLRCGKLAHATDIVDRGWVRQEGTIDFLRYDGRFYEPYIGDIVTNPPYDIGLEFVLQALDVVEKGRYVAMFLPLTFLETQRRYIELFRNQPPIRIWVYVKRRHCALNGDFAGYGHNNMKAYAWFVWEKGWSGVTELRWIDPTEEDLRLSLLDVNVNTGTDHA